MSRLLPLLRLNARVAGLALRGRWLAPAHFGAGYDRAAATYDQDWQIHLRQATDDLLKRLPQNLEGSLLDLGCGTGYTARRLAAENPRLHVTAVDISPAMMALAKRGAPANVRFECGEMLRFMENQETGSAAAIVSTWALGYSHPARLLIECGRVLRPGGWLAFIVNYADTLKPIFRAFQLCLREFPERVRLAAWPRFPRDWAFLERHLQRARFQVNWHQDGQHPIPAPPGPLLPWLRRTGILAGFDSMFDLTGDAADFFEAQVATGRAQVFHRYAAAIASRS